MFARHPRLVALIAHLGCPEYAGFVDHAERYERVGLDTTMALTDFFEEMAPVPRDLYPRLRDLGLAGKVFCWAPTSPTSPTRTPTSWRP